MSDFKDLDDFFEDTLDLPVNGKIYSIPDPDAETGLFCSRVCQMFIAAKNGERLTRKEQAKFKTYFDDTEEDQLYDQVLGPVKAELEADGVGWRKLQHIGMTAIIWVGLGRDAAEGFWVSVDPKEQAATTREPQDHKKPTAKRAQPASAGTKNRSGNPAKKTATRGETSSNTGS